MQVLKDRKVKFARTLGVSLLTSFWTCLWSSLHSRSYCLTLQFLNVLCNIWLPNTISAGILLAVHSVPQKISQAFQLGAQASVFSSHSLATIFLPSRIFFFLIWVPLPYPRAIKPSFLGWVWPKDYILFSKHPR